MLKISLIAFFLLFIAVTQANRPPLIGFYSQQMSFCHYSHCSFKHWLLELKPNHIFDFNISYGDTLVVNKEFIGTWKTREDTLILSLKAVFHIPSNLNDEDLATIPSQVVYLNGDTIYSNLPMPYILRKAASQILSFI